MNQLTKKDVPSIKVGEDLKFLHLANHRHENLFTAPIMIGGQCCPLT